MAKNKLALLTVAVFAFIATVPLLHSGLPPTHDGEYHVIRFYEFYKTLKSGAIYPRWAEDLNSGYGVPLFNFVYPLPNYVAALFHSFGLSFIDSFKYNLLVATILSALGFYFFAKYFTGVLGGVVGAIIYTFTPYRFVDTYIRGSVGEVWALAVLPFLLWSFAILIKEQKYKYIGLCAFLIAMLIFSHNILAVLFFPFIIFYIIFLIWQTKNKKIKSVVVCSMALVLGMGIAAIFWMPALFEKQFVRGLEVYDYKTSFPDLVSLLFPSWGTGFAGGIANSMSTQIGVVNILIIIIGIGSAYSFFTKRNYIFLFTLVSLFITIFLMLPFSSVVWMAIPLFHFVQFPWRYLSLVIVLCSFLATMLVSDLGRKKLLSLIFVGLAVATTIAYTKPAYYHNREDSYYVSRENFILGTNSPGNAFNTIWINRPLPLQREVARIVSGKGEIHAVTKKPERYSFRADITTPSKLSLTTAYFPGWNVEDSGRSLAIKRTYLGTIEFLLPPGNHFITVRFADTIVRRVGKLISLVSLVVVGGVSIYFVFRPKKR